MLKRTCVLTAAVIVLIAPMDALAQGSDEQPWHYGFEAFQLLAKILKMQGIANLEPVRSFRELTREPSNLPQEDRRGRRRGRSEEQSPRMRPANETAMIILGSRRPWRSPQDEQRSAEFLFSYIQSGGSVIFATDRNEHRILEKFGIQINAGPLVATAESDWYQGHADCPLWVKPPGVNHRLFSNVKKLATNRPGYLNNLSTYRKPIVQADLPSCAKLISKDEREDVGPVPFLAAWEFSSGGRILIVSDHSIFTTQMILQTDVNNQVFALNCLRWLADGAEKKKLLFMVDGEVKPPPSPEAQLPDTLPPLPPEAIVPLIDTVVATMEDENLFDEIIGAIQEEVGVRPLVLITLFALLGIAGVWFVFGRASPPARRIFALPDSGSEYWLQELIRDEKFGTATRTICREFFESVCDDLPDWTLESSIPTVGADGSILQRWTIARRVRRLWKLALRDNLGTNRNGFVRISGWIKELQENHAERRLQITIRNS